VVFDFEKNVIQLFESNAINYRFNSNEHLLVSQALTISFIPNCSAEAFVPAIQKEFSADKIIRLWEDEYLNHREKIDSRILSLLGISCRIYARQTKVRDISKAELDNFLTLNHLNSPIKAKYRYGLFREEKLVAVAAFSRSCPIQSGGITYKSHELVRYCSLLNTTVVGGMSKLISHFELEKYPEHLMTYVDKEWSDGRTYKKLGFKAVANTSPQKFWLSPDRSQRKSSPFLNRIKSAEEMREMGWTQLSNMGNIKLVKFLK